MPSKKHGAKLRNWTDDGDHAGVATKQLLLTSFECRNTRTNTHSYQAAPTVSPGILGDGARVDAVETPSWKRIRPAYR